MKPVKNLVKRNEPRQYGDFIQGLDGRPIKDLVIQETVGSYPPLLLLLGPNGHGKTAAARVRMARRNCLHWCEHPYEPCGDCAGCLSAFRGGGLFLDVCREFDATRPNWRSELSAYLMESRGKRPDLRANPDLPRVCAIDEFHRAERADQNSILKEAEDSGISFILMASRVPSEPAILSRAAKLVFQTPTMDRMIAWMIRVTGVEDRTLEPGAAARIAEQCRLEPRQTLVVLQELANMARYIDIELVTRYFDTESGDADRDAVIHQLA